jgi:hypothetical protein
MTGPRLVRRPRFLKRAKHSSAANRRSPNLPNLGGRGALKYARENARAAGSAGMAQLARAELQLAFDPRAKFTLAAQPSTSASVAEGSVSGVSCAE